MRALITILIVSTLFAGVLIAAGQDVVDLSTLNKRPNPGTLQLGGKVIGSTENTSPEVVDLSTLNRKAAMPQVEPLSIKGSEPITITPMFSIRNANITATEPGTVFTLPVAIGSSNATVYTPPIAIYGGS